MKFTVSHISEYEFLLSDRITKIKSIDEQLNLMNNSFVSFSGGKDSTILHYLIDMALPNNNIPRVFANTGLEFQDILNFVKELASKDDRFVILNQDKNIKKTLEEYGYPFKNKEHSMRVYQFNRGSNAPFILKYIRKIPYGRNPDAVERFLCPQNLMYQFEERGKYNYSNKCCDKIKKSLIKKWQKANKTKITITGMKSEEGGNRARLSCLTTNNTMFHPLIVCSTDWEDWFIDKYNIELCKLYHPPFNFDRTGCVGCPFNRYLQKELDLLEELLPNERKKAELIFGPVYDEYRRIGYRLKN